MTDTYTPNTIVQLTATFTAVASGADVNPTTVVFTVRAPDGTQTTPSVSNPSTGIYTTSVTVTEAGVWAWRAKGTGAATAQQDGQFIVTPNTF